MLHNVPRDVAIKARAFKIEDLEYLAKNGPSAESLQALGELVYRDMFTACYAERPNVLTLDELDAVKMDERYASYINDHLYNLEQLAKSCDNILNFAMQDLITSREDVAYIISHGYTLSVLKAIDCLLVFEMTGVIDARYISVLKPDSDA